PRPGSCHRRLIPPPAGDLPVTGRKGFSGQATDTSPAFSASNRSYELATAIEVDNEEEEAQRNDLLAAIVESSSDAIVSKDLQGIVASWNRGAQLIFGYSAEEMIGRSVLTLIPEDRHSEEATILDRIRRGE